MREEIFDSCGQREDGEDEGGSGKEEEEEEGGAGRTYSFSFQVAVSMFTLVMAMIPSSFFCTSWFASGVFPNIS
jgi:hypothetical protein